MNKKMSVEALNAWQAEIKAKIDRLKSLQGSEDHAAIQALEDEIMREQEAIVIAATGRPTPLDS